MAFLFCDSFDAYTLIAQLTDKWPSAVGTLTLGTSAGKFSGGAVSTTGANQNTNYLVSPAGYTVSSTHALNWGYWMKSSAAGTWYNLTGTSILGQIPNNSANGSTYTPFLGFLGSGRILAMENNVTITSLASGTATCTDGNWHWVEFSTIISTTAGLLGAYVDGVQDINFSGVTALNSGYVPTAVSSITIYPGKHATANGGSGFIDDFIMYDGTGSSMNSFPLGPQRISLLEPNGAGDSAQFTPSTGNNYAAVNSGYANSTTFVSDASTGNVDLYAMGDMSYNPATINAVVANYYGQNSGTGTSTLNPKIKTSSTVATNSGITLNVGANKGYQSAFYTDAGSSAWTETSVNAMQMGMGD